jgi:hypothetical protein
MDMHQPPTHRSKPATRTEVLGIRLTPQEREQINTLAHLLHLRPSRMVRHFALQAVAFYAEQVAEKEQPDDRS